MRVLSLTKVLKKEQGPYLCESVSQSKTRRAQSTYLSRMFPAMAMLEVELKKGTTDLNLLGYKVLTTGNARKVWP